MKQMTKPKLSFLKARDTDQTNKNEEKKEPIQTIRFKAHDIYLYSKVLDKIGMSRFLRGFKSVEEIEKVATDKKAALEKGRDMMALVSENMHLVEDEINAFLESVTGIKGVADLSFDEYDEIHGAVFGHKDFPRFFQSAFKLSVRIMMSK